jgi:hypothetical protein
MFCGGLSKYIFRMILNFKTFQRSRGGWVAKIQRGRKGRGEVEIIKRRAERRRRSMDGK